MVVILVVKLTDLVIVVNGVKMTGLQVVVNMTGFVVLVHVVK